VAQAEARAHVTGRPLTSRWRKCRQSRWELPAALAAGLDALFLGPWGFSASCRDGTVDA
jgi:hypothetical protein